MMVQEMNLITVPDAARLFGLTARRIHYWLEHEKITSYRNDLLGRVLVDPDEIRQKLENIVVRPAKERKYDKD